MPGHRHQSHSIDLYQAFMLACIQKSTSSITSFLRYCKEIATMLFWLFEHYWPHTPKMIVSIKNQLYSPCFSGDIAKIYKPLILGTLGMPDYIISNCEQLVEDFDVYQLAKNKLHHSVLFEDIEF